MRKAVVVIASIAVLLGLLVWGRSAFDQAANDAHNRQALDSMAESRSADPRRGLPTEWRDCLTRIRSEGSAPAKRVLCKSWTAQGVTTDMIALGLGGDPIM